MASSFSKQLILTILSLTLLLSVADSRIKLFKNKKQISEHDKEAIQYWLGGLRGLWFGFHKEFYHGKKKVDESCLSSAADTQIYDLLYFIQFGELQDIFGVADDLYKLYEDNTKMCDVQAAVNQVINLCSSTANNQCNISQLLANGQKNLFKLIHSGEALSEIFRKSSINNSQEMYETMFELGSEIAESMTSLLGI